MELDKLYNDLVNGANIDSEALKAAGAEDGNMYKCTCALGYIIISALAYSKEESTFVSNLNGAKILFFEDSLNIKDRAVNEYILNKYSGYYEVIQGANDENIEKVLLSYYKVLNIDINDVHDKQKEFIEIAKKLELNHDKIERCLCDNLRSTTKQNVSVDKLTETQTNVFFDMCISTAYMCKLASLSEELGEFFKRFIKVRYGEIPVYLIVKTNVNAYFNDKEYIDSNLVVTQENVDNGVSDMFENKSKLVYHIQKISKIVEGVM